jgi:hypothetical protein
MRSELIQGASKSPEGVALILIVFTGEEKHTRRAYTLPERFHKSGFTGPGKAPYEHCFRFSLQDFPVFFLEIPQLRFASDNCIGKINLCFSTACLFSHDTSIILQKLK